MQKGIIFDMDGVLIDSEVYYFKRRMNFFAEVQLSPGSRAINDYVGKTEAEIWQMLVPENPSLRAELKTTYRAYQKQHPIDFEQALRKEVKPVLKKLSAAGIPMALASSSPRRMIDEMLTATAVLFLLCDQWGRADSKQAPPGDLSTGTKPFRLRADRSRRGLANRHSICQSSWYLYDCAEAAL